MIWVANLIISERCVSAVEVKVGTSGKMKPLLAERLIKCAYLVFIVLPPSLHPGW